MTQLNFKRKKSKSKIDLVNLTGHIHAGLRLRQIYVHLSDCLMGIVPLTFN